jgi:hypothetical protein
VCWQRHVRNQQIDLTTMLAEEVKSLLSGGSFD